MRNWIARQLERLSGVVARTAKAIHPPTETPPSVRAAPDAQDYPYLGAQDEDDALTRFRAAKESDPFPGIPPALLNSAHIEDYMIQAAMVFPYQRKRRKTASYALRIGAWKAFWDPAATERDIPFHTLQPKQTFELPPNSLIYVKTKEVFQLPNYMAVRFNLHIDLVHKGLLLGTGPLVDPGFRGHLLVPVHNMTANTYILAENDEFIWAEFTKTSMDKGWQRAPKDALTPTADFAEFPADKFDQPVEKYLEKAMRPHMLAAKREAYPFPANAIPRAVEETRTLAKAAETQAKQARQSVTTITTWGYAAGIAIFVSLVGLGYMTWQMVQSSVTMVDGTNTQLRALKGQVDALQTARAAQASRNAASARLAYCDISGLGGAESPARRRAIDAVRATEREANSAAQSLGQQPPFPSVDNPGGGPLPSC